MLIPDETEFFKNFPVSGKNDWLKLLEKENGETPSGENLKLHCFDQLSINILQDAAGSLKFNLPEKNTGRWKVRTDIDFNNFNSGIENLLKFRDGTDVFGIAVSGGELLKWDLSDVRNLIAAIPAGREICFDCSHNFDHLFSLICGGAMLNELKGKTVYGAFDFPGDLLLSEPSSDGKNIFMMYAEAIRAAEKKEMSIMPVRIGAGFFRRAGASAVQELVFSLSLGTEFLLGLKNAGIDPSTAVKYIYFQFESGSDFYLETAKYRSFRILWKKVLKEFGCEESEVKIHALPSGYEVTLYEKYSNIIRIAVQSLSSVIGGADIVSAALPYSGNDSVFSDFNYSPRDLLLILKHESGIYDITDPVEGSYSMSEMIHELTDRAFNLFKDAEQKGGFIRAYEEGWIQSEIEKSFIAGKLDFFSQKKKIAGLNCYVDHGNVLENQKVMNEFSETEKNPGAGRLAEEMEILRYHSDIYAKKMNVRPVIAVCFDPEKNTLSLDKIKNIIHASGCSFETFKIAERQDCRKFVLKNSAAALFFPSLSCAGEFDPSYFSGMKLPLFGADQALAQYSEDFNLFSFDDYKNVTDYYRIMLNRLKGMADGSAGK